MILHKRIGKVISSIKGEDFILDERIPISYLFSTFFFRAFRGIRGAFIFKSFKRVFVSSSSKIKCASKIQMGYNLSIDRNCYIDALSIEGIVFGDNVSIGKYTCIECSGTLKNLGKGLIIGNILNHLKNTYLNIL